MTIGTKIKSLREKKGLSQPDLAFRLNISQGTLSNIESGDTKKIDFLLMDKVCKEFKVDFDYFISDSQNNSIEKNTKCEIIGFNHGTINFFPENIIEQMRIIIEENKSQKEKILNLENRLKGK